MSERSHQRRPATFRLDDPGVVVTEALDILRSNGHRAVEMGRVEKGSGQVHFA